MKTQVTLLFFFCVVSLGACQKDILDTATSDSIVGSDGITNFIDLTSSGFEKSNHPLFKALDSQRYYFEVRGQSFSANENRPDHVLVYPNFTATSSGNFGDIELGAFVLTPGSENQYAGTGGVGVAQSDPTLLVNFGKETDFNFKGVSGETDPFFGEIHFPKLMRITSVSDFSSVIEISRNENYVIKYESDLQNDKLPVVVSVSWDIAGDPNNANAQYKTVRNLVMVDDNGKLTLSKALFKDIPQKAQMVSVTLRRGNAIKDNQGLFFLIATEKQLVFNLTD